MNRVYIQLEIIKDRLIEITVKDDKNVVKHFINQEPFQELEEVLKSSVKDFIKEYITYFNDNKNEEN